MKNSVNTAYPRNACKILARGASATEKDNLFGGTAARCYRLEL